jgi:heavy metal sensor kinase
MNTRSLRFRLVLWYAVWLGLIFTVTGALLYLGVGAYLERNLAQSELSRANRVAAVVARLGEVPASRYAAEITADFAPEASGRYIRVTRADGTVLYHSGEPLDQSFDPSEIAPAPHELGIRREKLPTGAEMQFATVAIRPPSNAPFNAATVIVPQYLVEAGESLAPALTELHRLLLLLALGFLIVTVVALAGGHVLVRRALRPVEEITRRAEGITSRNLSERLPVAPTGDEFEHLSQALNRMIARLDESFQNNRRFLADASHELRTPLTILRSELESMQRPGSHPDFRETMDNLLEEVQRLTRIVESLFALSRLDAGLAATASSHFDLAKLAATTAEHMCLLAEDKGVKITCQTPAPVFLEGDHGRFKQVIVNLLDNAIKYTPAGGAVTLTVREQRGEAVCEVSDNGIGIPAAAIPHVFDRFFRVDQARTRELGGAGIGLSIVKAICTAHNGRVEVESAEGRGSCFRVCLPLPEKSFQVL